MKFFVKNNQLDEMQEKKLLIIESRGFWGIWIALFISLMLQQAVNAPLAQWLPELIIFLLACVYALEESLRNGIWDRHMIPTLTGNIFASLLGGVLVTVYTVLRFVYNYGGEEPFWIALTVGLFVGVFTAILIFALCQIGLVIYNKKHRKLENDEDADEDIETDEERTDEK